jgi:poly(ADP-ribose) glycohydrolase ARH3
MRVAPVGLFFRDDLPRSWEQARLSALPTHLHPLGIEGAQLLALAVALCSRMERFDRAAFFTELLSASVSAPYRARLEEAARVDSPEGLAGLGNRIEALESVPTAIACFSRTPESYEETVSNAIFLGGDTDTIAAMAGALSGAWLGAARLPQRLVGLLESSPKGRDYLVALAGRLFAAYAGGRKGGSGRDYP